MVGESPARVVNDGCVNDGCVNDGCVNEVICVAAVLSAPGWRF